MGFPTTVVEMMDDFVAFPSRWRIALITLGAAIFVVLGLWFVGAFGAPPEPSRRYSSTSISMAGWAAISFFGLCVVFGIKMLFDTREQLRIGLSGIRWARWSDQTIPWSEITNITTWSHKGQSAIVLHLRDPALFPGRGLIGLLGRANRMLTRGDIAISVTGTDRSFGEAMSAVEQFRPSTPTDGPR